MLHSCERKALPIQSVQSQLAACLAVVVKTRPARVPREQGSGMHDIHTHDRQIISVWLGAI